jgi:long-chain acyl-CoA synthetase
MKHGKYHEIRPLVSLKDLIDSGAEVFNDKPAFLVKHEKGGEYTEISFKKVKEDVDALGTFLLHLGLKGEKIAVIGPNCYQWVVAYFSIVNGAGVVVPLDKELSPQEIKNLVKAGECKAAFATSDYYDTIKECGIEHVFKMDAYEIEKKEDPGHIMNMIKQGGEMLKEGNRDFVDAIIDPKTTTAILFTSGTTDVPKGVMLSHENITFVIKGVSQMCHLQENDRSLSILPIHHTFESTIGIMVILFQGSSIAFYEGLKYVVKNLQESQASILVAVPLIIESIYEKIWKQAKETKKDGMLRTAIRLNKTLLALGIDKRRQIFHSVYRNFGGNLRFFVCGAASISPTVVKGLMDLGFDITIGYGLTETAPLASGVSDFEFDTLYRKPGSCGRAIPGGELKIINEDEDGIGEIIYRGDNVMQGYYKMPDKTADVIIDGWFHTGDLGFIDKNGWLYITGRKKNVIVTKTGKNIYPEELEELLKDNPYIKESMVYGREDDKGEGVAVAVQVIPDTDAIEAEFGKNKTEKEVHDILKESLHAINEKLPSYKRIRSIVVRGEEFIKTTTKKIKRNANM